MGVPTGEPTFKGHKDVIRIIGNVGSGNPYFTCEIISSNSHALSKIFYSPILCRKILNTSLIIPTKCFVFIHYIHYLFLLHFSTSQSLFIREKFWVLYLKLYVVMYLWEYAEWNISELNNIGLKRRQTTILSLASNSLAGYSQSISLLNPSGLFTYHQV